MQPSFLPIHFFRSRSLVRPCWMCDPHKSLLRDTCLEPRICHCFLAEISYLVGMAPVVPVRKILDQQFKNLENGCWMFFFFFYVFCSPWLILRIRCGWVEKWFWQLRLHQFPQLGRSCRDRDLKISQQAVTSSCIRFDVEVVLVLKILCERARMLTNLCYAVADSSGWVQEYQAVHGFVFFAVTKPMLVLSGGSMMMKGRGRRGQFIVGYIYIYIYISQANAEDCFQKLSR